VQLLARLVDGGVQPGSLGGDVGGMDAAADHHRGGFGGTEHRPDRHAGGHRDAVQQAFRPRTRQDVAGHRECGLVVCAGWFSVSPVH